MKGKQQHHSPPSYAPALYSSSGTHNKTVMAELVEEVKKDPENEYSVKTIKR